MKYKIGQIVINGQSDIYTRGLSNGYEVIEIGMIVGVRKVDETCSNVAYEYLVNGEWIEAEDININEDNINNF